MGSEEQTSGSQLVVKLSLVKTISPVPDAPNSPRKREEALSKKYEKLVVSRPEDPSYFCTKLTDRCQGFSKHKIQKCKICCCQDQSAIGLYLYQTLHILSST